MTRWTLWAAPALLAFALWQPAAAAPPAAPSAANASYTFEQYRDYRIKSFAESRKRLAQRLSDPGLSPEEKAKLQQRKAYYDWLAQMPAAERDRRYRQRFDAIDANHDGKIDPAERAARRDKERAYYRQLRAERAAAQHK
ncbi:MAG TPA: EF-hand domain-containing protein [Stellaceae bacterium]|nr:EF-hand domain-containing protein [Stellaceae bacterium]